MMYREFEGQDQIIEYDVSSAEIVTSWSFTGPFFPFPPYYLRLLLPIFRLVGEGRWRALPYFRTCHAAFIVGDSCRFLS